MAGQRLHKHKDFQSFSLFSLKLEFKLSLPEEALISPELAQQTPEQSGVDIATFSQFSHTGSGNFLIFVSAF
jgi:hypothetical protein